MIKRFYKSALRNLPTRARSAVSSLDFRLANRQVVCFDAELHPGGRLNKGAVTISLDFEMAWGWQFARNQEEHFVARGLREREQVPEILASFDRFHIPATWATVGHLFLESCRRGAHGLAHETTARVRPFQTDNWRFHDGDWFQFDPCSSTRLDPAWYAPDLIERIIASPVHHEIACHGFSHVGFGRYCRPEVADDELDQCREAMGRFGLVPQTMVFPGNDEGNFESLARSGIRIVRAFPKPRVHVSLPVKRKDGMWGVHVSSALDRGKDWTIERRISRLQNLVQAAADTRLSVHIWAHPSMPRTDLEAIFVPFLRYCAEQRDKGMVDILTIDQLVARTVDLQSKSSGRE